MVNRNMYNTSLWLLHIHVSLLLMFEKRRLKQLSFDFTWEICHLLDITAVAGHLAWLAVLFHDFIHVHSPWARADNPLGPKFWCQQEGLITMVICCKFKKNLFNLWLYTHLLYRRWSGADNPRGQNFIVNRNLLSLWSFATSFKQISLKSDFIPFFFSWLYTWI